MVISMGQFCRNRAKGVLPGPAEEACGAMRDLEDWLKQSQESLHVLPSLHDKDTFF